MKPWIWCILEKKFVLYVFCDTGNFYMACSSILLVSEQSELQKNLINLHTNIFSLGFLNKISLFKLELQPKICLKLKGEVVTL